MSANTVPLTWNGFVSAVANLAVEDVSLVNGVMTGNAQFNQALATAISYSENRCQRDLDLLALETSRGYVLTTGINLLAVPPTDFVTVRTIEVGGAPLLPVSKEYVQNVFPSGSTLGTPTVFAMYGGGASDGGNAASNILLGPAPDTPYAATVTGTQRMPSLYYSATTPLAATGTTWISTNLPDLLVQAAMIPISEYQRQFGATSNDPQMPGIYEQNYMTLMNGVRTENLRARFAASAWSSAATSVAATPSR
jgi:hypothetical protein